MFDQILQEVSAGKADAGLIIHEGQLTYSQLNLHRIVDLGEWWLERTDMPLPLGGNVVRRDLGNQNVREIAGILQESIKFGLAHRRQAVEHAHTYARDMEASLVDEFVGLYVNQWTLDFGARGREAVRELLRQGRHIGLLPDSGEIDFIRP